ERLAAAGIEVESGLMAEDALGLNPAWTFAHTRGRPFVTWKLATTLDGRSAAADGSSRWITARAAREDVHGLRARCDTILVGTGTVAIDDPHLTVRHHAVHGEPPLRAVMGIRAMAADRRIHDAAAPTVRLHTRDPHEALEALYREHDRHHVLLEGGSTLAAAFLRAELIDEVIAYVAPALLGTGLAAVGDLGISTIGDTVRLHTTDVAVLGSGADATVRITSTPITKET
uniref:RibD family protein n=1 Tax=Pseudactinotalea sp. TaxID=1926260 RepID=UPI003B3ACF24